MGGGGGGRLLGPGRQLPPQLTNGHSPPLGGGGSGRGDGLGGFCLGGGGVREGWLVGGGLGVAIWGVHAPKAKRWSITGSPYLPLPSL